MLGASGCRSANISCRPRPAAWDPRTTAATSATSACCPKGITSQDPRLYRRLDVDQVAERVVDVFLSFDTELRKIVAPLGRSTTLPIGMSDALGINDYNAAQRLKINYVGPVSDDVGWLNAGATITVHGHASNGVANGMAQGNIYVAGNIGARGMTMTKNNPRFEPPQLWVLGSAGDYFAEFMAGGMAVICGHAPQNPENVLGYRPMVGMVGGRVLFRGPHQGFSHADAKMMPIDDDTWR
jgi:glutamate synthase domain-containing protein 3